MEKVCSTRSTNLKSTFQVKKRPWRMKPLQKSRICSPPRVTNSNSSPRRSSKVVAYLLSNMTVKTWKRTARKSLCNNKTRPNLRCRKATLRSAFASSKISLSPTLLKRPTWIRSRPSRSLMIFLTEQARLGSESMRWIIEY